MNLKPVLQAILEDYALPFGGDHGVVLAFCFSVFETTNLIGVALGSSLAFVILLLGYVVCWIVGYFQKPEMKPTKDDPV